MKPERSSSALLKSDVLCDAASGTLCVYFDPFRYLDEFERSFPAEFKAMELAGMHPLRSHPLHNPYAFSSASEDFRNIGEHSIAVAHAAGRIASMLVDHGNLEHRHIKFAQHLALLHNVTKAYERMFQKSNCSASSDVLDPLELVLNLLTRKGTPTIIIQSIATACQRTGHKSLKGFVSRNTAGEICLVKGRLFDKIVHLANALTCTTVTSNSARTTTFFTNVAQRLASSHLSYRYPAYIEGGLLLERDGSISDTDKADSIQNGQKLLGSYVEIESAINKLIIDEIKDLAAPDDDSSIENLVLTLLAE